MKRRILCYLISLYCMKKTLIPFVLLVIISTTVLVLAIPRNDLSLFDANVEALSDGEASITIECDSFSMTMICQKTCVCGATWRTLQGYGHATKLHGTCVCGRIWD